LGWAKRGEDEGECERETNRDFAHGFFLFARGKDCFSAKKKFTPRMDWLVRGRVKFVVSHPFHVEREKDGAPRLYGFPGLKKGIWGTQGTRQGQMA
jgi:hypothetical protein